MTLKVFRLTALAASALVLAGCAAVDFDKAISDTNQTAGTFTSGKLELSRNAESRGLTPEILESLLADE